MELPSRAKSGAGCNVSTRACVIVEIRLKVRAGLIIVFFHKLHKLCIIQRQESYTNFGPSVWWIYMYERKQGISEGSRRTFKSSSVRSRLVIIIEHH